MSDFELGRIPTATQRWATTVDSAAIRPDGLKPAQNALQFDHTMQKFASYYDEQVTHLFDRVPPENRKALAKEANALFGSIIEASFIPAKTTARISSMVKPGGEVELRSVGMAPLPPLAIPEKLARETVLKAHTAAQRSIQILVAKYAEPQHTPQIIQFRDGNATRVSVVRPAPQIETLVLRGGGAKGIGNPPALVELEHAGMLKGLSRVVGTSAGALTAVGLASGLNAEAFQRTADEIDVESLKVKPDDYAKRYPTVPVSTTGYHGGKALERMDQISAGQVSSYLRSNWDSPQFQAQLKASMQSGDISQTDALRLQRLMTQDHTKDRTAQMVTFRDLSVLHKLEPSKFKELTLTGWDTTAKAERYFNAFTTPNMPIAIAGRISMSIPTFFASVTYDIGHGEHEFLDGGVGSNMPSEAVLGNLSGSAREQAASRTLLMTFDEQGKAYSILHGDSSNLVSDQSWGKVWLSGNSEYEASTSADRRKVHEGGPNSLVVFHGDIDTLDLSASAERKEFASLVSTMRTLEFIEGRQNQASHQVFDSMDDAARSLTAHERQQVLAQGAPVPTKFKDLGAYESAKSLYDAVVAMR